MKSIEILNILPGIDFQLHENDKSCLFTAKEKMFVICQHGWHNIDNITTL